MINGFKRCQRYSYCTLMSLFVKNMGDYRKIKKQLEQKEQKLAKANDQTKQLDNYSKDVNAILDSLKPTKLNKNLLN